MIVKKNVWLYTMEQIEYSDQGKLGVCMRGGHYVIETQMSSGAFRPTAAGRGGRKKIAHWAI